MSTVRLVGYNPEGQMVYDALMESGDYWDEEHPWDDSTEICRLRLTRLIGQMRESDGSIYEEWEVRFHPETGHYLRDVIYNHEEVRFHSAGDGNYVGTIVPLPSPNLDTTQQTLPL